jgi:hypothetical protein
MLLDDVLGVAPACPQDLLKWQAMEVILIVINNFAIDFNIEKGVQPELPANNILFWWET